MRHWGSARPSRWRARGNQWPRGGADGDGVVVALLTKFLAGTWVVTLAILLLIVVFARTEGYYAKWPPSFGSAIPLRPHVW